MGGMKTKATKDNAVFIMLATKLYIDMHRHDNLGKMRGRWEGDLQVILLKRELYLLRA